MAGQAWEVEHVIPFAMGGADDMTNWRPVHARVCHAGKTKQDVSDIARAKRREARHVGAKRSARPLPGSRDSEWKRTFNNGWVRR